MAWIKLFFKTLLQGYPQRMRPKHDLNSLNITIQVWNWVFCSRYSPLMTYLIIGQRKKEVCSCRKPWIKGNRQYKFRTAVSEGSSYFILFLCFKLSIPYHTIILASSDQLETIFFIHAQPLTRFYRQSL